MLAGQLDLVEDRDEGLDDAGGTTSSDDEDIVDAEIVDDEDSK